MEKAGVIVRDALAELMSSQPEQALKGVDFNTGVRYLNRMLDAWTAVGLDLGTSRVQFPDDYLEIPDAARAAVVFNLAIELANRFGYPISQSLSVVAANHYKAVVRLFPVKSASFSGNLPRGSGNVLASESEFAFYPENGEIADSSSECCVDEIIQSATPPVNPKIGTLWLDTSKDLSPVDLEAQIQQLKSLNVPHLKALPTAAKAQTDVIYNVASFYDGWAALSVHPAGGGRLAWLPTASKALHNGVTHYAPEALTAWDGTQAGIATLLNWSSTGIGVWVRIGVDTSAIDLSLGGVVYGITQPDQRIAAKNVIDVSASNGCTWQTSGIVRLLSALDLPSSCRGIGPGSFYLDPNMTLGASIGGKARGLYSQNKNGLYLRGIKIFSTQSGLTQSVSCCISNTNNIDIEYCEFSDFGSATYYTQGLLIFGGNHVYVNNNKFYRCSGDGLAFSNGTDDFTAIGNHVEDCEDWGIVPTINCKNGVISHNTIINCGSTATGSDRCQNVTIGPNIIDGCEHGVRIAEFVNDGNLNRDITIIVGSIRNCLTAGVSVENTRGRANISVGAGTINNVTAGQGVRLVNAQNVNVSGLVIKNTSNEGILEHASAAGLTTGSNTIEANTIDGCTYGVRQLVTSGTLQTSVVNHNVVDNAAVSKIALVDYEGKQRWAGPMSYTPEAFGATTPGVGTYTAQSGKYYLDGDLVDVTIAIAWSAHTGAGGLTVTLPFAIADFGQRVPVSIYYDGLTVGTGKQCVGFVGTAGNVLAIRAADPSGGAAAVFAFDTAATLNIQVRYRRS